MPSENKTPNYGLNQWQGNEYVKREDFVDDNAKIDAALTPTADPAQAPTSNGPFKLVNWVSYFTNRIKAITGLANWWNTPDKSLKDLDDEITTHKADYTNLVDRVNNLKANDLQARREILDIKLKLDEVDVMDFLNKTGIGFYDLFEGSGNVDVANTTATIDTTNADVKFTSQEILKMKQQTFDNFNFIELALYDKSREFLEVENTVTNSVEMQLMLSPNDMIVGEKFYHNGEVYTVTGVDEI